VSFLQRRYAIALEEGRSDRVAFVVFGIGGTVAGIVKRAIAVSL
jgi:hypothetical protein